MGAQLRLGFDSWHGTQLNRRGAIALGVRQRPLPRRTLRFTKEIPQTKSHKRNPTNEILRDTSCPSWLWFLIAAAKNRSGPQLGRLARKGGYGRAPNYFFFPIFREISS